MTGPARHLKFLAFLFLLGGTVCDAGTIAYVFSGSVLNQGVAPQPLTIGFQFTTLADVLVDSVGVIDVGQNGLAGTETVGVWDSSGTLLFSDVVGTGTLEGPVVVGGQFSFTPITPLLLPGGHTYTIAALVNNIDAFTDGLSGSQSSGVPSLLTVSAGSFINVGASLTRPTSGTAELFDLVNFTVADTPEPVSAALAVSGLTAALLLRRRKMTRSTGA